MIFVTVGNATQPFTRLLSAIDALVDDGVLAPGEVIMQTGNTPYRARNCEQRLFVAMDEFSALIGAADVIVAHCGAGTVQHAARSGKVPVVMPRRVALGEHVDDQLELATELANSGRVILALDPVDLPDAIARARSQSLTSQSGSPRMLDLVDAAIRELTCTGRGRG